MNSNSMETQLRNFKDFLLLYNKVTELCFSSCVDNFFSRNLASNESECVDKCVTKFARFNQSMMTVYVEVQTEINERRVQELETLSKEAETKAATSAASTPTGVTTLNADTNSPSISSTVGDKANVS